MNKKQVNTTIQNTEKAVKEAAAAAAEKLHDVANKVDATLHELAANVESKVDHYRDKAAQKLANASEKVES